MKKIVLLLLLLLFCGGCLQQNQPVACTADAKQCPDGSYVGRVPPDCRFAPCPAAANCSSQSYTDCPSPCVVCPPCEVCSSVSCQTEEFCKRLGFDRDWYANVSPSLTK